VNEESKDDEGGAAQMQREDRTTIRWSVVNRSLKRVKRGENTSVRVFNGESGGGVEGGKTSGDR
jgi:hypothetical protein